MQIMNEKPKQEKVRKRLNPSPLLPLFHVYTSIVSNFKAVKGYCMNITGNVIQLETYWLLLLIGSIGSVRCIALHELYCFSHNATGLRNTQRRLVVLINCGLVIRSKNGNSVIYSLSFQAEKMLFSGIDKESLLELSAMVKGLQDADKAKVKPKKKVVKKVVKSVK